MNFLRAIVNAFRFDRTNWKAVALCFAAATVFWLFSALNKEHTSTLQFPITFEFDKEKYIPVRHLPENVQINVTGTGWDLLRRSIGIKIPPLGIPLERPTEITRINGSSIPSLVESQLSALKINYVVTDTLLVAIEMKVKRKLALTFDRARLSFDQGLGIISPVVVLPDSVWAEGPPSVLTKATGPIRVLFPRRRISDNVKEMVEIRIAESDLVTLDPPEVTVMFEVGEVIEVMRAVPVRIDPDAGSRYGIPDDSISVLMRVPKSIQEEFHQADIMALLSFSSEARKEFQVLPSLINVPTLVEVLKIDSIKIKLN